MALSINYYLLFFKKTIISKINIKSQALEKKHKKTLKRIKGTKELIKEVANFGDCIEHILQKTKGKHVARQIVSC